MKFVFYIFISLALTLAAEDKVNQKFKVIINRNDQVKTVGFWIIKMEKKEQEWILTETYEMESLQEPMVRTFYMFKENGVLYLRKLKMGSDILGEVKENKLIISARGRTQELDFPKKTLIMPAALQLIPSLPAEKNKEWLLEGFSNLERPVERKVKIVSLGKEKVTINGNEVSLKVFSLGHFKFAADNKEVLRISGPGGIQFISTDEKLPSQKNEVVGEYKVKLPYEETILLKNRQAARIIMPDGKALAIWSMKSSFGRDREFSLSWGETPFVRLKLREVPLEDGGVTYAGYVNSYIRHTGTSTSSRKDDIEYHLIVGDYAVTVIDLFDKEKVKNIKIKVRKATAEEMIKDEDKRGLLIKKINAEKGAVRLKAVRELAEMITMGDTFAGKRQENIDFFRPLLKDQNKEIAEEAHDVLVHLKDVKLIMKNLQSDPKGGYGAGFNLGKDVGNAPKEVSEKVLNYLKSDNKEISDFALGYFFSVRYEPAAGLIKKYMKSEDSKTRLRAMESFKTCANSKDLTPGIESMLDDKSLEVLRKALWLCSYCDRDKMDLSIIISKFKHSDEEVRAMAAAALDCSDSPEAHKALMNALGDSSPKVRSNAATYIGRCGYKPAKNSLIKLLEDKKEEVRYSAVNGLRWLGDPSVISILEERIKVEKDSSALRMLKRTVLELKQK